ncbi:ATP-binding protein [Vibrio sp. TRT 17S01]|uniref:ATP-binding protein n=1 Tax=Vibrio sp. TRT 17S01 TaxID=3418505 RepID=UPI003CE8F40A
MSFRAKTIIGIASIEIVLLMLLVFSAMSFLSDASEKHLIQRANTTANMFAHATKDAVLSTDLATLDDMVNEIMSLEDLLYVRITRQGKDMACAGDKDLLARQMEEDHNLNAVSDGIFDKRVDIVSDGTVYGHIDMGFGTSAINQMLSQAKQSIVSIAFVEVFLVAIFSLFLGSYLTKSLIRLTKAAKTVSERGPGYQLKDDSKDELGDVARAFDEMSGKLSKSYQELKQARQEAEDACLAKSRFLASMSHEIRTPMNGVLGIMNLLEETPLNREQKQLIKTGTESGNFLLSVINDILDFTRMESSTLLLESKPFDFRHCVESVVDSFGPIAKQRDLILHCYVDGSTPSGVIGDENRVKQVLNNLIGNAFKFTQQGGITVKVSAESHGNNCLISCSISDTGIGINRNAMDYLFDEFTMVDQSYSRTQEGSGLGLAICKRLCELMDGGVEVTSEPDMGSTFTFTVCLEIADQSLTLSVPKIAHGDFIGARILVAEDNKANQLVIKNMFKNAGVDIDLVGNGVEAVEQVQKYQYDLIFMDISMPLMDGMEACQTIRKLDDLSIANTPIIALTAHALTGDKEQFLASGMNDYLSKPVRLSQLLEKMDLFLNKQEELINMHIETESPKIEFLDNTNDVASENNSNMDRDDLVDETILVQMIEDTCAEVIPELIEHYIVESESRLAAINVAVDQHDKDKLEFEVHTLGSSALALGNRKLSEVAREMEALCLQGKEELAYQLKDKLLTVANASLKAIDARKQQGFVEAPDSNR